MRNMALAGFTSEPLAEVLSPKDLDAKLLATQKACDTLNSVWREQARMRVKPALEECNKRYFQRLAGSLRFVDQKIPASEQSAGSSSVDPKPRYFNVPAEIQDNVTMEELAALKQLGVSGKAIETFRRVILDGDVTGISPAQHAILRYIHTRSLEKHTHPDFGVSDSFTLQLHLDSRMLPTGQAAEAHTLPSDARIIERLRFSGKAFIDRATLLCTRIDEYKSRIDLAYNHLDTLKQAIVDELGLQAGDAITKAMKRTGGLGGAAVREFFATFGQIQDLKAARRELYRKIAKFKKNWFGFLSNIEVSLARKYQAAVVREDLTVEAIEKASPAYKGRAFNKLLNNGSKGQYQNRAADKLQWNGVPEMAIPSWYTSRACLTHAVIVEKRYRKGEQIYLPCCGLHDHADAHAADTIASYLFLRPIRKPPDGLSRLTSATALVRDNHTLLALP